MQINSLQQPPPLLLLLRYRFIDRSIGRDKTRRVVTTCHVCVCVMQRSISQVKRLLLLLLLPPTMKRTTLKKEKRKECGGGGGVKLKFPNKSSAYSSFHLLYSFLSFFLSLLSSSYFYYSESREKIHRSPLLLLCCDVM